MIVLADNDLIIKLAQCDLLGHLDELLNSPPDDVYITPTARFQLRGKSRDKGVSKCGNEETYYRIEAFVAAAKILPAVQDLDLLKQLTNIPNIDSGELLLFASMVEMNDVLLFTSDKKALESLLQNAEQLVNVMSATKERVFIFESILLLALEHFGFPALKQKLLANPKPDGLLRLMLNGHTTKENFTDCLCSYGRPFAHFLAYKDRLPEALFTATREV